jgi:Flp pilus assembly protein TadD
MNQKSSAPTSKTKSADVDSSKSAEADAYAKVCRYLETGKLDEALTLARSRHDADMKNAQGVCLMRMGKADEAVRIYRTLVLDNTGLFLRQDLPVVYKTNYAISLLLSGHPAGAIEILKELSEVDHPRVQKLRSAIGGWKSQLNIFQKLGLALGVEPKRPVQLEFAPGDLE